jgi:hypothetical protein
MNLQAQPSSDVVGQHPFGQLLRIEQAMRRIARSDGILAKSRRK